ncbi:MAG: cobalamin biosynthesis protein CbiD [Lachnospiraceae bacterium]|nr:cobalamin biosynthesis protein CbiD [Lachnospiraceae bacterium]
MRNGFTTGSCAAAASKAAVYMLLTGKEKKSITIDTPKGISYNAEILDIKMSEKEVSCAVKKDSGDDPDVTNGALIYSTVSFMDGAEQSVIIEGGKGVGKVTKPGLDRPVGDAAINTVPRQMIEKEVLDVCDLFDIKESIKVVISVPEGEEIAKKTFNPKLGIEGGISIIGTSGIVEPMSTQAILDTIKIELKQRKELGFDYVAVSPGNYGLDFMRDTYGYDLDKSVKCSNFIGLTVDMAVELGFKDVLFVGHIGKLIKVAGGIMNTHSKEADCRMEIITALGIKHKVPVETLEKILDCVTTEEAGKLLKECGKCDEVFEDAAKKVCANLERRAQGKIKTECVLFSKELGELAKSDGAADFIKRLTSE